MNKITKIIMASNDVELTENEKKEIEQVAREEAINPLDQFCTIEKPIEGHEEYWDQLSYYYNPVCRKCDRVIFNKRS